MSLPLLKMFLKKNWLIWVGFTVFFLFELLACIFLMDMIDGLEVLGISGGEGTLYFMSTVMPLLGYMFPMVFYIFIVYRVIFRPIDSTSMGTVLSSGIKRTTYISTAVVFLIVSLFAMFTTVFVVCGASMLYWGAFNWGKWALMCFSVMLATMVVAFISFFFASAFSPGNIAKLGFIGLPVLFLVLTMIGFQMGSDFFMYLSPFGWMDMTKLVMGTLKYWWLFNIGFMVTSGILITASIIMFKRKQFSI